MLLRCRFKYFARVLKFKKSAANEEIYQRSCSLSSSSSSSALLIADWCCAPLGVWYAVCCPRTAVAWKYWRGNIVYLVDNLYTLVVIGCQISSLLLSQPNISRPINISSRYLTVFFSWFVYNWSYIQSLITIPPNEIN